jgi:hypothetical protein
VVSTERSSELIRMIPARTLAVVALAAFLLCLPTWGQNPCELKTPKTGTITQTDVTLALNMALGMTNCTATINGTNGCNVVMLQRVIDASLPGGTCHPTILNWVASTSSNVAGYNVYRSTTSGGTYSKLNASLVTGTTFTDGTCQPGLTYYYVATSVDVSGNESAYSTPPLQAVIPSP